MCARRSRETKVEVPATLDGRECGKHRPHCGQGPDPTTNSRRASTPSCASSTSTSHSTRRGSCATSTSTSGLARSSSSSDRPARASRPCSAAINLLETPTAGHILIEDQEITGKSNADANRLRRDVGMVFQSFNLFPHLTAKQNVMIGQTKVLRKSKAEAEAEGAETA